MKNFNIKRNREPLSESDISKGQDFSAFMNAYNAKQPSFFKTKKFYVLAGVAAAVLITGSIFLLNIGEIPNEERAAFIAPLFENANAPDTTFGVDATTGGILFDQYGSVIYVPPSAFLDSSGKIVSGPVDVRFRQYLDVADIFMAGIPMTYDSAGITYHFETAGMFEISAWQNGQALKTNPDALIRVAMVSNNAEDRFNTYYLDTAAESWQYRNSEPAVVLTPVVQDTASAALPVLPEAPVAPRIADKTKPSFAISFNPVEFPELVAYKGVRFEVDETKTPYDRNDKKVAWEDVTIRRVKNKDELVVTFTAGVREAEYVTHPVVDEKDFSAAKASWEKRNAEYEALKKQRDEKEKQQANALAKKQEAENIAWMNDSIAQHQRSTMTGNGLRSNEELIVLREFIIADFGIWNADCPDRCPDGDEIIFDCVNASTGEKLDIPKFNHVVKGKNALYSYPKTNWAHFTFDPSAENMLWAITRDKKLATVSAEEFAAATAGGKKEATFRFTVSEQPLKSSEEVRTQMEIPAPKGM